MPESEQSKLTVFIGTGREEPKLELTWDALLHLYRNVEREIAEQGEPAPSDALPMLRESVAVEVERARPIKPTTVEAAKFKKNLEDTLATLRDSFSAVIAQPLGALSVDEIEIALEVGAEGKVGILGSGASVSGKSSITVRFKRR